MSAQDEHDDQHDDDEQNDSAPDIKSVSDQHAPNPSLGAVTKIDYRANLPTSMTTLPVDEAGRPVPTFVQWIDDKPDFRVMSSQHLRRCVMDHKCWVCGHPLGRYAAFVVGPMCLVNLNSAEPPSHYNCAFYSATHCPFLVNPNKVRRETHLPDGMGEPAGVMIRRNPGVTAVIVVTSWTAYRDGPGLLFNIGTKRLGGHPDFIDRVEWYREGRTATRAEILESLGGGIPLLAEACDGDPACLAYLQEQVGKAMEWVPG